MSRPFPWIPTPPIFETTCTYPFQVQQPLQELKSAKKSTPYLLEQYLEKGERAKERHEYFNGTIIPKPMAKGPHNIIVMNTGTALNIAIEAEQKPYTVFGSNQKVYLPELNIGLYPDVLVVCEKPQYWDDNQVLFSARSGDECESMAHYLFTLNLESHLQKIVFEGDREKYFPVKWSDKNLILVDGGFSEEYFYMNIGTVEILPYNEPTTTSSP